MKNYVKLKQKMLEASGRSDFTNFLAELLGVSLTTAGKKLNGNAPFKQSEIVTLTLKLGLSGDDVKNIFVGSD